MLVPDLAVVVDMSGIDAASAAHYDGASGTSRTGGTSAAPTGRGGLTSAAVNEAIDDSVSVPLLVVEISDPSKRRFDQLKLDLYRECGVASCWLVDPDEAGIEAYDLVDDAYVQTATAKAGLPLDVLRPF
nr:Uma2 family endonuclease [Micromonospora sp. DSM 115978]